MSDETIFLARDSVEGGCGERALEHSIFTESDSWGELIEAAADAVECHFDNQAPKMVLRYH